MSWRWDGFGRSLLFAALAALGFVPFALAFAPIGGAAGALGAYALLAAVAYASGLPATARQRVGVGLGAAAAAALVWLIAPTPREAAFAAAALVAVVRSGILRRGGSLRAWAAEAFCALGSLGLARALLGPAPLDGALAVWGFFLAQSLFFLFGGLGHPATSPRSGDPFDVARARALAILESARG
jgi:hypothetical protein